MNKLLYVFCLLLLFSCSDGSDADTESKEKQTNDTLSVKNQLEIDTIDIQTDYKMDNVDPKERREFKENLANIEKKHGIQWNFCKCVASNDSINKALQTPNLPDAKLDELIDRLTVVEEKCQAFLIQNPNQTPEERARHEKKVRDCLKASK